MGHCHGSACRFSWPRTDDSKYMKEDQGPLVYLACPYSHPYPDVREARFNAVNKVAARMMRAGVNVISPISHNHPIVTTGDMPGSWEFWEAYCRAILSCCHRIVVLRLDGWQESVGVAAEIKIMEERGFLIEYTDE